MPRFCFLKSSQGIHRKKPKRKRCFGKSSWPQTAIGVASIGDPIHPTSQHHPLLEALGRGPFRRSLRRVMQAQNMQRKEENITSAFTKLGTHPEVSCMKSLKIAQCLGGNCNRIWEAFQWPRVLFFPFCMITTWVFCCFFFAADLGTIAFQHGPVTYEMLQDPWPQKIRVMQPAPSHPQLGKEGGSTSAMDVEVEFNPNNGPLWGHASWGILI